MLKDMFGAETQVGDSIAYSVQSKGADGLRVGVVTKIVQKMTGYYGKMHLATVVTMLADITNWRGTRRKSTWTTLVYGDQKKKFIRLSAEQAARLTAPSASG